MVLFKINRLYDEIQRVYNEHYKDCKHQEVHDFYRAVTKRMRTTYQIYGWACQYDNRLIVML